jgi:hypothetical protein
MPLKTKNHPGESGWFSFVEKGFSIASPEIKSGIGPNLLP